MTTVIGSSRIARVTKEQSGDSQFIGFVDHLPRSVIVRDGSGHLPDWNAGRLNSQTKEIHQWPARSSTRTPEFP